MKAMLLSVFLLLTVSFSDSVDSLKQRLSSEKNLIERCRLLKELSDNAPDGLWQAYNDTLGMITSELLKVENAKQDNELLYLHATYFNNKGIVYLDRTNYFIGMSYLDSAYSVLLQLGDSGQLSLNRLNFGAVHDRLGQRKEAIKCYEQALKLEGGLQNSQNRPALFNNLSKAYLGEKDTLNALYYITGALKSAIQLQKEDHEAVYIYKNIANIYTAKQQYDSALFHYHRGLEMARKIDDNPGIALHQAGLARVYSQLDKKKKALFYADSAFKLVSETSSYYEIEDVALTHAQLHEIFGDASTALVSWKMASSARDSINSQENLNIALSYQLQREVEERDRIQFEREKIVAEQKEHKTRTQYIGIFSFILFLLTGFVVLRKTKISMSKVNYIGFTGLILLFQFIDMNLGPLIDSYSFGNPAVFMVLNIAVATLMNPVKTIIELKVLKVQI